MGFCYNNSNERFVFFESEEKWRTIPNVPMHIARTAYYIVFFNRKLHLDQFLVFIKLNSNLREFDYYSEL